MKIICLHHSGGNSYYYYQWKRWLQGYDVVPLDLPGHGRRIQEPLLYDFTKVIEDLCNEIVKALEENEPYVIFGHSMGGLLITYILDWLERNGKVMPQGVIFSGAPVPGEKPDPKMVSEMSEEEFLKMLLDNGGTKRELIENSEFRNCFLPIIKADCMILDNRPPLHRNHKFQVEAVIFNGQDDTSAIRCEEQLKEYFSSEVQAYHFEGGHFYFVSEPQLVCECIRNFVENELGYKRMYNLSLNNI